MNIYQKIAAVMEAVKYLAKDDKVEFGNTKYKAMSEEKVTAIMREQMLKQGLVVYPESMSSSRNGNISHVDVTYRMVNIENPDESIEIASCGDGYDTQDKGSGKAMTYAFKYMWLRTFAIPTGEDPDKICNEEIEENQRKEAEKEAKKAAKKAEEAKKKTITAEQAVVLETLCDNCGVNIDALLKRSNVKSFKELTAVQYTNIIKLLEKKQNGN